MRQSCHPCIVLYDDARFPSFTRSPIGTSSYKLHQKGVEILGKQVEDLLGYTIHGLHIQVVVSISFLTQIKLKRF